MLGLGWSEIFLIVVVALLAVGPDKLPEVLRGAAKVFRQLQRMASDVRQSLDVAMQEPPPVRPPPPEGNKEVAQVRRETTSLNEEPPTTTEAGHPTPVKPASPPQD